MNNLVWTYKLGYIYLFFQSYKLAICQSTKPQVYLFVLKFEGMNILKWINQNEINGCDTSFYMSGAWLDFHGISILIVYVMIIFMDTYIFDVYDL